MDATAQLDDLRLGDYLTEGNLRLLVVGAGGACLVAVVLNQWRSSSVAPAGWLAPVVALFATGWLEWPDPGLARLVVAAAVGLLAFLGLRAVGSGSASARHLPMLALLVASFGVWLAVPENGPAVVVAGVVVGLWLAAPGVLDGGGAGLTLATAWAVVLGAGARDLTLAGGLLGLAPLAGLAAGEVVRRVVRLRLGFVPVSLALLGHLALAVVAARWVGVAPDATWERVAILAAAAVALGAVTRTR